MKPAALPNLSVIVIHVIKKEKNTSAVTNQRNTRIKRNLLKPTNARHYAKMLSKKQRMAKILSLLFKTTNKSKG